MRRKMLAIKIIQSSGGSQDGISKLETAILRTYNKMSEDYPQATIELSITHSAKDLATYAKTYHIIAFEVYPRILDQQERTKA